jgi:hypothetical protein
VNKKETGKEYSEFMQQYAERYERLMPKPTVLEVFCGVWFTWLAFLLLLLFVLVLLFGSVFVIKFIWNLV